MNPTKESLERLIHDQIEESQVLEYKAVGALNGNAKAEITKDISAFANARGGTVIYGIAEFQNRERKHLPERFDPVNQLAFSREWLDQILGLIQPRIPGLEILPIHVGPTGADYCYVVSIPAGETAHQALDLKYYRRRNFESTPMQDYEVRDVMNRSRNPRLEVRLRLGLGHDDHWYLSVAAANFSSVIARFIQVTVELPPLLNRRLIVGSDHGGEHITRDDGLQSFRITLRNKSGHPLFAGDTKTWVVRFDQAGSLGLPEGWPQPVRKNFYYRAFADQMAMIEAEVETIKVVDPPGSPTLSADLLAEHVGVQINL